MGGEFSRRDALFGTGGVIVGGIAPSATGAAAQAPGSGPTAPELAGKTIVVQTRNRPITSPAVLSDCRFEPQAGRLFLIGIRQPCSPDMPSWTDGVPCCIAWEGVDEYLVFNSLSDYYARLSPPRSEEPPEESDAESVEPDAEAEREEE